MKTLTHLASLVAGLCLLFGGRFAVAQDIRTLNLDFGGAGAYVGSGGVLSSPTGTHWNVIDSNSINSNSLELLDEFGQSFNITPAQGVFTPLPNVTAFGSAGISETTQPGIGPLNDSLRFEDGMMLAIRELDMSVPFDVAVYLTEASTLELNFSSVFQSNTSPVGFFPGVEGRDYLLFEDLIAFPMTIGIPLLPGVIIQSDQTVEIAAIQVRGVFVSTPEPAALLTGCFAAVSCLAARRRIS
ncbi:MAG: hypothetical protein RH917_19445 [Lacipirellulaceae bacterium]